MKRFSLKVFAAALLLAAGSAQAALHAPAPSGATSISPGADLSSGNVTATGSTTARTLADWMRGRTIVTDTTATRTFVNEDMTKAVIRSNAGSTMNDTLPSAVTVGSGWTTVVYNADATGTDTITPSAGTIGGGSAFALVAGQAAEIVSDGTNYQVLVGGCVQPCAASVTTLDASSTITSSGGITDNFGMTENAGLTVASSAFKLSGNQSKTFWSQNGISFIQPAATYTDTSSSGATGAMAIDVIGADTINASSSTTYSAVATLLLTGPIAGTNVSITTPRALDVTGLVTLRGGASGALTVSGGVVNLNSSSNNAVNISTGTTTSLLTLGGGSDGVVINSNSAGSIKNTGLISTGTKFTTSGCSVSSTTGGATAGTFTLGANNCTVVVTMNGATGLTAPNGWTCQAHDRTGISVIIDGETSSTTTTASIVIPVTAGTTDVIAFSCVGY